MTTLLTTTHEVIETLGGEAEMARKLGLRSDTVVYNWLAMGFPPRSYVAIQSLLKKKRARACDSLFPKMLGIGGANDAASQQAVA